MRRTLYLIAPVALGALATSANAQQNNISWASFVQDPSVLSGPSGTLANDTEERDVAWGDLDNDGWTDLVIVRKQPYTTSGRRTNVLLMNEQGVLTDRTAQYATATDVAGDNGFQTPTNDRDVILADVNGDGWLDVITCTTITPNQPKSLSHPRVYINLGENAGQWLGLRFENARIPDFGTFPNFCGVGAGDVTGDGSVDLYFAHYHQSADVDLDDRLLINDGNGFFTDESSSRMTATMLNSSFGVSAVIADMNGDGFNDIVKDTALGSTGATGPKTSIAYNNPNNPGNFNVFDEPYLGAPYHTNTGDLNMDGKLDMVIADDGSDKYMLNQGNDAFGRVIWSPAYSYNTDDGFGSNNLVADLNDDGWAESIICDIDVDIPGTNRRMHIYHNRGGTVGGFVNLDEESGSGSTGVTGMTSTDLRGTHDVAVFDIDNDGDNDMILSRYTGTYAWINQLYDPPTTLGDPYCQPAASNSTGNYGHIEATGSNFVILNNFGLVATDLPPNQFGYFITSATQGLINNPGGSQGNLCLGGQMGRFVGQVANSGPAGEISINVDLNALPAPLNQPVLSGQTWNFTAWYRDLNPGTVSNFTDAVSVMFL